MQFTLTMELSDGEVWRGEDLVYSLQESFKGEAKVPLEVGTAGALWTRSGDTVGKWEVIEPSAPRVEFVRAGERGAAIDNWCVVDGGRLYPFGEDAHGKELAEREAAKWEPWRYSSLPWEAAGRSPQAEAAGEERTRVGNTPEEDDEEEECEECAGTGVADDDKGRRPCPRCHGEGRHP